jgi:group I intron endonuclease
VAANGQSKKYQDLLAESPLAKLRFSIQPKRGTSGVYAICNSENGKVYIGSSVNMYNRWYSHRGKLLIGTHPNKYLQNAYFKNPESLECVVVEETKSRADLFVKEQMWIDFYRAHDRMFGYNHQPKAGKSNLGLSPSEETKQKLRDANKGRILGEWTKDRCLNISKALKGRPSPHIGKIHSDKTRKRMSEGRIRYFSNGGSVWNKGGHYSDLMREKFRVSMWENKEVQARKGKTRVERKCKFIPVVQLSLDGTPIRKWDSISKASRTLNKGSVAGHISNVCNGKSATAYGFKWEYA